MKILSRDFSSKEINKLQQETRKLYIKFLGMLSIEQSKQAIWCPNSKRCDYYIEE